ncbi:MAG TPA: hypothetical protein VEG34_09315, partial [Thermoanaerobaculia bacterium]|nr:hypothetical protein [Thermoanaerobaculia bacterium]
MSKPLLLLPFLALAALLLLPARAGAGGPELLRDIHDQPGGSAGSSPRPLTPFGVQIAFVAAVPNGPDGLWVSDGTAPGTRMVFQGCDGDCAGIEILGVVNGFLLFAAGDPEDQTGFHHRRLWRTDGTRAGTVLLAADFPRLTDPEFEQPPPVAVTSQALYFLRCAGGSCALWQSDGTPAGTVELKRYGGPGSPFRLALAGDRLLALVSDSDALRLWAVDRRTGAEALFAAGRSPGVRMRTTVAGGKLFFPAGDGEGTELWASDGTAAGTRAVTDFEAGSPFVDSFPQPSLMTEVAGRFYFVANDILHGFELWRSDGTPEGTVRVSDFGYFEALAGLAPFDVAEVGGKVLFRASDGLTGVRLWMSDGTPESTAPFRSLCRTEPCSLPQSGTRLIRIGGKVFFLGQDGLWSTDGTLAGTQRFAGLPCSAGCETAFFQPLRGRLAYLSRDTAQDNELWTSDGTPAGTRRLTDVPGPGGATSLPVAVGTRTFFAASDRHGEELWVVDGGRTRLVADIGRAAPDSQVREMTPAGDRLFFTACDVSNRAAWVSGGTPETTAEVPETAGHCSTDFRTPVRLAAAGGRLFFEREDADRVYQLWSTDGGAPIQVTHLTEEGGHLGAKVAFQGRLLAALHIDGQTALWQSNATGDGLVKLVDLPGVGTVGAMWEAGAEVYMQASAGGEFSLWRTDGTPAGTHKLMDGLHPTSGFVRLGSMVLFAADSRSASGSLQAGLWKTDGTAAGTVPVVRDLADGLVEVEELTPFQGRAYFRLGHILWRSDGTAAGTVPVRRFTGDSHPLQILDFGLTALGGKLVFAADDGVHGRELWETDGTAAGTRMILDLIPGRRSGLPGRALPAAAGGKLYFAGNEGTHGTELWVSDG